MALIAACQKCAEWPDTYSSPLCGEERKKTRYLWRPVLRLLAINHGVERGVFDLNRRMSEGEATGEHLAELAQDAVAFAGVVDDDVGGDGVAARSDRPDVEVVSGAHAWRRP